MLKKSRGEVKLKGGGGQMLLPPPERNPVIE